MSLEDAKGRFAGRIIAGKYQLEVCVGRGAMGEVYRALHTELHRRFAVKVVSFGLHDAAELAARFSIEARAASRLEHPNCVQIVDFGREPEDELLYLVMEYLDGVDLESLLRGERAVSAPRAVSIGEQIAGVLAEAHEKGIVHRDLKPANVMILRTQGAGGADIVKVCDFGIARILGGEAAPRVTQVGALLGTPAYMSPEQFAGDDVDARSDVFSWGALMFRLLVGRPPFTGSIGQILYQITAVGAPSLAEVLPGTNPALAAIVGRAMERDPARRYANARELATDLLRLTAGGHAESPAAAMSAAAMTAAAADLALVEGPRTVTDGTRSLRLRRVLQHPLSLWAALGVAMIGAGLLGALVVRRAHAPAVIVASADPSVEGAGAIGLIDAAVIVEVAARDAGPAPVDAMPVVDASAPAGPDAGPPAAPDARARVSVRPVRPVDDRPGIITVVVTREGAPVPADVYLDGVHRGKTPVELDQIRPGSHVLEVRASGRAERRTVHLKPGQEQPEAFYWSP